MIKYYLNYYRRFIEAFWKINKERKGNFSRIGLIDTSIASSNVGDQIIMKSIYTNLREMFPNSLITTYPSHLYRDYDAKLMMSNEDLLFVGGTNLLSSNMDQYYQWKIDNIDRLFFKNKIVLMGVGWWQYQSLPNRYTTNLLKSILSDSYIHSVRDSYTLEMLRKIGINNVTNTTCPTLWEINNDNCLRINKGKCRNVITTLTYYHADSVLDLRLLKTLENNYDNVYLWIQGIQDFDYFKKIYPINFSIKILPPTLESLNKILEQGDIEYIGTRLHSGIRALQFNIRTLIIAVDNRAYEIGKDTGLNVIKRKDVDLIANYISSEYKTQINLPNNEIKMWKEQFIPKEVICH